MIKVLLCAIVSCVACLAAVFAYAKFQEFGSGATTEDKKSKFETEKTRMVSVPILSNGEVLGYVVARFEFVVDSERVKASAIPAESFVSDQAFRVIYTQAQRDFRTNKKQDLLAITRSITEGVNSRLGSEIVKDVLIDSWNYLTKKGGKSNEYTEP